MASVPIKTTMKGLRGLKGVPVGGGFALPPAADIAATEINDLIYDVRLKVELVDGRYECSSIDCAQKPGGPPVTTNGIRTIPVGSLIAIGLAGNVMKYEPNPRAAGVVGGPVGPWSDDLVSVAAVYRLAFACGLPPTTEVAKAFQVSQSVAGNRVMKARRAGLLDATSKGKAKAGGA